MVFSLIAPAIAAASSIFGSSERSKSQEEANETILENARLDREQQLDFAQQGIRWRVEDAQAAGVHPLYSLGASLPTYSPSPININPVESLGSSLATAGQGVSRAIAATASDKMRKTGALATLSVERGELENEFIRSKIALNRAQLGPPLPSAVPQSAMPGQGDYSPGSVQGGFNVNPVDIPAVQPGVPSQQAGAMPEITWVRTSTGFQPVPNREAFEDADIGNPSAWSWYWRNQILPTAGISGNPPPDNFLPRHAIGWRWSPNSQEWQPRYDTTFRDRYFHGKPRRN